MQFLVIGYDGTDPEAPARRQAARDAHLAAATAMKAAGQMLYGAALLGDDGRMIGSACLVDLPDRAAVDAWIKRDPYVTGGVWKKIEVTPCRVSV